MGKLRVIAVCVLVVAGIVQASDALSMSGYIQPRWQVQLADSALENSFSIRRAYVGVGGTVSDCFAYKVLLTMTGGSVSLYDAYLDIKPIRFLSIRAGQFQQPIGMEKLTSSSSILFPERTYASDFTIDRDIGLMLSGKINFLSLQVGVFNGVGRNRLDDNQAKDITARLALEPWRFIHLGGAYQMGKRNPLDTSVTELVDISRWGAELALTPWNLRLAGEIMGGTTDTVSHLTYYAEAAWMFETGLKWMHGIQPAVRYESLDPNASVDDDLESILTAGINLHLQPGDKAKLMLCYRMFLEDQADDQIIAQLQLKFP